MDENRKIQKATKLPLQAITNENPLALRGLKDLQLLNTPRLLYLAGKYDECIKLCETTKELTTEDFLYWLKSEKEKPPLREKVHTIMYSNGYFNEYLWVYEELLRTGENNEVDEEYAGLCLVELGELNKAIPHFTKALEFYKGKTFSSGRPQGIYLLGRRGDTYYCLGEYEKAIEDYLAMNYHIGVRRLLLLAECYIHIQQYDAAIDMCENLIPLAIEESGLLKHLKQKALKDTKKLLDKIHSKSKTK